MYYYEFKEKVVVWKLLGILFMWFLLGIFMVCVIGGWTLSETKEYIKATKPIWKAKDLHIAAAVASSLL